MRFPVHSYDNSCFLKSQNSQKKNYQVDGFFFFFSSLSTQENYQIKHQPIQMNIEMILKIFFMKKIILKDFIQLHPFSKWRRGQKKIALNIFEIYFNNLTFFFLHINFFSVYVDILFFSAIYKSFGEKKNFITARWRKKKVTREFQTVG